MKINNKIFSALTILIVLFSFSSCKECLDCVGKDSIRIDSIRLQIDSVFTSTDTTVLNSYPSFWDSTFTGQRIALDVCDGSNEKWTDYDGKETIVISRYGTDSIFQGIQKMTVTTKWNCN